MIFKSPNFGKWYIVEMKQKDEFDYSIVIYLVSETIWSTEVVWGEGPHSLCIQHIAGIPDQIPTPLMIEE